jgi:hypothetical protein
MKRKDRLAGFLFAFVVLPVVYAGSATLAQYMAGEDSGERVALVMVALLLTVGFCFYRMVKDK